MSQLQAKQISKFIAAWIPLSNRIVTNASSLNVTSALTLALATAGNNGTSVPLNSTGSSTVEGVITGSGSIVPVYAYPAGVPIEIAGNQVYGVITFTGSAYTVSFYTLVNGTQTTASLNQSVNLLIPYSFSFNDLPFTALLTATDADPGGNGASTGAFYYDSGISVTATNVISNLTKQPIAASSVVMQVNGQVVRNGTDFTVNGQAITWNAGAAGYTLATTDTVGAWYTY